MCEQALLPGGMAAAPRDVQDFCSELCWDHEILIWRVESDLEALRALHGGSPQTSTVLEKTVPRLRAHGYCTGAHRCGVQTFPLHNHGAGGRRRHCPKMNPPDH